MSEKNSVEKIKNFAKNMRKNILEMALTAGANSSHFGGALSIVEIVASLFASEMNIKIKEPNWPDRDRFILSKGHACLAYYAALCELGYIDRKKLKTFEQDGTDLLGHPVMNRKLGIEFSNGSLGMGLSLGIGLAISAKKRKKNFNVYVVVGDGECNEGSIWEGAMSAPNLKLDNLYVIIDKNNFQQTGTNKQIMDIGNIKEKWKSFGWDVTEIDGHDIFELQKFFQKNKKINLPKALIANTIKGKGFSFAEQNNDWHHSVLSKKLYDKGLEELK